MASAFRSAAAEASCSAHFAWLAAEDGKQKMQVNGEMELLFLFKFSGRQRRWLRLALALPGQERTLEANKGRPVRPRWLQLQLQLTRVGLELALLLLPALIVGGGGGAALTAPIGGSERGRVASRNQRAETAARHRLAVRR